MRTQPDHAVLYLSPQTLQSTAVRFQSGFDGLVTYAVKANDRSEVLGNLVAAGIQAFDVASPAEMKAVRAALPDAVLHYNNPVRSRTEIAAGICHGVTSWSVDDAGELAKLAEVPRCSEVAVRFSLPVNGAAYDFGEKFGAAPREAARLLSQVAAMGLRPALCFHPGTQCEDPQAWAQYIAAAAAIASDAGVGLVRLNVGGGFAAHRGGVVPDLEAVFGTIKGAAETAFGPQAPELVCEPGRAMVAEAFSLATRVKSLRNDGKVVFLNDGIYGALADLRDMGAPGRVRVMAPTGERRRASQTQRVIFGPTCDSIDRLPDGITLPADTQEGDYVLFDGMGAYSVAMSTTFNGYGVRDVVTVRDLAGHQHSKS